MHGLVNRSIQRFVQNTYGEQTWADICHDAELGFANFESMLSYDSSQTEAVLNVTCKKLQRGRIGLLEDIGTFLISDPASDALRRLLRFGGENFEEFLLSLDDLHDRAQLALPDLDLPSLELREHSAKSFELQYKWQEPGFGTLVLGILRAMADDYGALVLLDHSHGQDDVGDHDRISISLLDAEFAQDRGFELGGAH